MSDLTDFLLRRIAEDEAVAREASPAPWHTNEEADTVLAYDGIEVCEGFALSGPQLRATTRHIARHDPARILAEREAKRRIVERLDSIPAGSPTSNLAGGILRYLAAIYADHPDYREEWKP